MKRCLVSTFSLLVILLINHFEIKSQSFNWQWVKNIGGSNFDYSQDIAIDTTDNIYVTGYFESDTLTLGANIIKNNGQKDIFLAKYNSSGNLLWAKGIGSKNDECSRSVTTDKYGNIYITGYFESTSITFDTITLVNYGVRDIFLAKYNPNGNVIWAINIDGDGADQAYDVTTDIAGNVYIAGEYMSGLIRFGTDSLSNKSFGTNVFLAKYDSSGMSLWARGGGGNNDEETYGIVTDTIGNVYVTGSFKSPSITFGTNVLSNSGDKDIFIVKYNPSGSVLWAKKAGGNNTDHGESIAADMSGNIYLTGKFSSLTITFDTITLTNKGNSDILVVKYNSSGDVLWAKNVGGNDIDYGSEIVIDKFNNIYITGDFHSAVFLFAADSLKCNGTGDFFLIKYDTAGNEIWGKSIWGNYHDEGTGVVVDALGDIYVTGFYYTSNYTVGVTVLPNKGLFDVFMAKLSVITNITAKDIKNLSFIVYPNPVNGIINIRTPNNDNRDLFAEVINATGQIVLRKHFEKTNTTSLKIDLTHYPKGIYFLKLINDNVIGFEKIIIE